ncbi:2,5-dichloro-2,5-cyclohexadiene-1,4-diol dehydrogenase [compost metagenome]
MSTGWTKDNMPDLSEKVVIITGASSGLGLETAKAMAEKNATVILAVRNMEKGQVALDKIKTVHTGVKARLMKLDLADLGSVRTFATQFLSDYGTTDLSPSSAAII